ncbi:hypothetical protein HC022_04850 [Salipiger sp. HF18]|uniref:hypothetical protein n=1 Tax=Salipiger sp. HF18 TaxID=2721557 RepID=UPI00142E5547|nr:hypothetical protein [Salipiger sp. HF18]NIY95602.1 hypothetical protein [Salipiger sp. HF18]
MSPSRLGSKVSSALVLVCFAAVLLALMAENTLSRLGLPENPPDLSLPMRVALGEAVIGLVAELSPSDGERP